MIINIGSTTLEIDDTLDEFSRVHVRWYNNLHSTEIRLPKHNIKQIINHLQELIKDENTR